MTKLTETDRNEWNGLVRLASRPRIGTYSQLSRERRRAILAMDAHVRELEQLAEERLRVILDQCEGDSFRSLDVLRAAVEKASGGKA